MGNLKKDRALYCMIGLRNFKKINRLLEKGLKRIAKMQNLSQNKFNQTADMRSQSQDELERISKMRIIKNYETISKIALIISYLKPNHSKAELFNNSLDDDKISDIKRILNRLRYTLPKRYRKEI